MQNFQNFVVEPILHWDNAFIPWRVGRWYVVVLQLELSNFSEVHDRFVPVADLEILIDHPCDLPSREKAFFFLYCFFFNKHSSLQISVDLLDATYHVRVKKLRSLSAISHW